MTSNNNIHLPLASDLYDKADKANAVENLIAKSGIIDILEGAAADGLMETEYRYADFNLLTMSYKNRERFAGELCRAGYHVDVTCIGSMIISWGHADEHHEPEDGER